MRICDNGIVRELLPEEMEEQKRQQAEYEKMKKTAYPTAEERLDALEMAMLELLIGGDNND